MAPKQDNRLRIIGNRVCEGSGTLQFNMTCIGELINAIAIPIERRSGASRMGLPRVELPQDLRLAYSF